ncbi:unnamed protein product [Acanthoscelides obtectus]|uniref:Ubiquitin carboxyl-terminal hydrolase n=1 Tax=Acanthoscelides obtectus TaxID=200917 RepID=A0A9P0JX09_ACAOB|nr:unnamed protein product [Acanthoscelides obtectus]CAK1653003.1 Ubiquitin carboxyl-terminal hydrolase 36 [Acanthoscelides obtectus]
MPASTLDPVKAALRTQLAKNDSIDNNLDTQLAGSSKKALLSNIEFETAGSYQSTILDKLKSKYIVLNSSDTPQASKPEETMGADESLKLAKYELFPLDAVQLGWNNCDWSVGAGMVNMGNTCYLNSTLQALFHIPALVNWLMSDKDHTAADCQDSGGLCIICAMRKTLQDSQQRNANSIRPILILNKLRLVCEHFIPGRQEDAHEYLRFLVEAMEKAYLSRFKNHTEFDPKTKETTPLNQIMGGYLRLAVRCLKCGHVRTNFDFIQDLCLDIRKAQTIDEALEVYFSREKLEGELYHCEACQKKVPATMQYALERAPMVLCIHLKRFTVRNNKITKHVTFRQRLDLTRYARHKPNVPLVYRLVALVTHMGPTVSCGHYTAVAQAPSGNYYQFDDSMVRPISHQAVFNTNAYIMFYELESSPYSQKQSATPSTSKAKVATSGSQEPSSMSGAQMVSSSSSSSGGPSKSATMNGGVGYTSDTFYGPQLPPNKIRKTMNGSIVSTNGNNNNSGSPSPTGSPPEDQTTERSSSSVKNNEISSSNDLKFSSPVSSPNIPTSVSSLSSPEMPDVKDSSASIPNKPLVPYETDETSSSEDSNHSAAEATKWATTKATVGDWQVTSSTDVDHEPSSQGRVGWEKNKFPGQTTTSSSSTGSQQGVGSQQSQDNTVSELFKMSHSGYSAPVTTWNGTRSQLDKEVNEERREERKRNLADTSQDQNQKAKHLKTNNYNNNHYKSNPGYNPIQEYHNAKNWNGYGGQHYKPFYNGNRHRRFFNQKNCHKNYRYRQ